MQGPQRQDACSSVGSERGSERGRARAGLPALLSPGCPRSLSLLACLFWPHLLLMLPHARGSAVGMRCFPPCLGPLLPSSTPEGKHCTLLCAQAVVRHHTLPSPERGGEHPSRGAGEHSACRLRAAAQEPPVQTAGCLNPILE